EIMNKETLNLLKETIEHFKSQQTKSIEMFENFVNEQNKQSLELIRMLGGHIDPQSAQTKEVVARFENNFKQAPVEKPAVAAKPMNNGNGTKIQNGAVEKTKVVDSPAEVLDIPKPIATPAVKTGQNTAMITDVLMKVVSEKTGYPAEMLELSMDKIGSAHV